MGDAKSREGLIALRARCVRELEREGLRIRRDHQAIVSGNVLDFIAANRAHHVRVVIVPDPDIDAASTRDRIATAIHHTETRVFVRWTLRWRMISNLERWGIGGVAVDGL